MEKKKKLIVFDIDDTLTKSEFQHQLAYVNTMKAFGITTIDKNWKTYRHHTDSYILKVNYENNLDKPFSFSFIPDFEDYMTKEMQQLKSVSPIKGAPKIIDYLNENPDYAITFATGSLLKPAFLKLEQAGIDYHPALVAASNELFDRESIVRDAIEKARSFYDVNEFETIVSVGDGIWDLKTAANLGVHFLGIGQKNYTDFEAAGIKAHIDDWDGIDFEKILMKLEMV